MINDSLVDTLDVISINLTFERRNFDHSHKLSLFSMIQPRTMRKVMKIVH